MDVKALHFRILGGNPFYILQVYTDFTSKSVNNILKQKGIFRGCDKLPLPQP